ncbi:hypothetical protein [Halomonas alkalisoli]|uniref:hypothetical protein n=1 Tax=Halomonas alkalisoli TaxID=2907158 RepID=UPI001F36CAE4|nr:hypothetical protein [Halomonas alkalisoli]MCE9683057.1 hypothetical protein [Halomonas alkalisoli]
MDAQEAQKKIYQGQAFDNRVAESIGMDSSLFHLAIEEGGLSMHLLILIQFEEQGKSHSEVCDYMLLFVLKGLDVIESRFGYQELIDQARTAANRF